MRETVLLINFQDEKQLRDLKMILFTLKIRMKKVEKKEYLQQIGFLAGMKNMEAAPECYEGEELEKEMMVFAGISNQRLDQILSMMRKNGVKRVDYKAILTETKRGQFQGSMKRFQKSMRRCTDNHKQYKRQPIRLPLPSLM